MEIATSVQHVNGVTNESEVGAGLIENLDPQFKFITFTAPSAAGKSSLIRELRRLDPRFGWMRSVTTRERRPDDDPKEYTYVTPQKFTAMKKRGDFLWTVPAHGKEYGTLHADVGEALQAEHPTLMHVVPECVAILQRHTCGQVAPFFVLVNNLVVLEERLRKRDPDQSDSYYQERIESCQRWEQEARESGWYIFVDNSHQLDTAIGNVIRKLRRRADL